MTRTEIAPSREGRLRSIQQTSKQAILGGPRNYQKVTNSTTQHFEALFSQKIKVINGGVKEEDDEWYKLCTKQQNKMSIMRSSCTFELREKCWGVMLGRNLKQLLQPKRIDFRRGKFAKTAGFRSITVEFKSKLHGSNGCSIPRNQPSNKTEAKIRPFLQFRPQKKLF